MPPGLAVATLYGIPGSHPAAAAAAALGTKRVPFRRVDLLPLIQALEIDGRRISGSTAIGSSLALLGTHRDLRDRFDSHPAWEVADRWFPGYAGHTPKGTAKRQWLELIGDTHG